MSGVRVDALDHIVLCVRDVWTTIEFYERVLGMEAREERPGKWSLHFGRNKISLQDAAASPTIAEDTIPGTGNFCLLTEIPMGEVVAHLAREGVLVEDGPGERAGATSAILSVYIRDPDGNLVELSNAVTTDPSASSGRKRERWVSTNATRAPYRPARPPGKPDGRGTASPPPDAL